MVNWSYLLCDVIDSAIICLQFSRTDLKCFLFFVITPVICLVLPHIISLVSPADSLVWLAQIEALPLLGRCDNIEASFEPTIIIVEHFIGRLYLALALDAFQFLFVADLLRIGFL